MTTRIICRLLAEDKDLLGWCEVMAKAKGDGKLWAQGAVIILPEKAGFATHFSMHWADINVESRVRLNLQVTPGQMVVIHPEPAALIVVGPMPEWLPPVTVKNNVGIQLQAAQLGARDPRLG